MFFRTRARWCSTLFLIFAVVQCGQKQIKPGIAYDLVKEIHSPTTIVLGVPMIADPIPYHWKKNPGRHSSLPSDRKWENTQVTFNTNKTLFVNHSLDSIYFPPNSSYTFFIDSGEYDLTALTGLLTNSLMFQQTQGQFLVEADGVEILAKSFAGEKTESWKKLNLNIKVQKKLTFRWQSKSDHFFLAEPLLYVNRSDPKPNVILIVLDSARKDFFNSYGFPFPITPNMDKLALESVFFENPFSNGNWTKPSMISFFHSEYSSNLGLGNSWFTTKPYQRKVYYGKKRENLVTALRGEGYFTKSIMNNVFFLDYTTVGIDLGFHNSYQVGMDVLDTEELTNHAIDFIAEMGEKPFFLHFNLNTPHASYAPPQEDLVAVKKLIPPEFFYKYESPVQRYIGEMHYTDREIGRLIKSLKEKNLYDNTMIILTGDHGELFSPHHDYSYHFIMKTRFGHGETHYDEEINVPYFIKLPADVKNIKKRIGGQSSLLSLVPTILGLLKIKSTSKDFKGVDYSDCIVTDSPCPKEEMIYTEGRMSESVRTEAYKYIRRYPGFTTVSRKSDGELHSMTEELYDLKDDPEEKWNLTTILEKKEKLNLARSDFQRGDFLKRNRIHIRLPACILVGCKDIVTVVLQGALYDWTVPKAVSIQSTSAKTVHFEVYVGKDPTDLIFYTVNPEMEGSFRFSRNGTPVAYRLGKWGLESLNTNRFQTKDFILSDRIPLGWQGTELPWVYNDGFFSGTYESTVQKEMGKEVKKILETWGYIHE